LTLYNNTLFLDESSPFPPLVVIPKPFEGIRDPALLENNTTKTLGSKNSA